MGGGDHHCDWRDRAEALEALLTTATARLAEANATIASLNERVAKLQSTVEKLSVIALMNPAARAGWMW